MSAAVWVVRSLRGERAAGYVGWDGLSEREHLVADVWISVSREFRSLCRMVRVGPDSCDWVSRRDVKAAVHVSDARVNDTMTVDIVRFIDLFSIAIPYLFVCLTLQSLQQ